MEIPTVFAFEQLEHNYELGLDAEINELSFKDKASSAKCVFHHGTDFYDFTPFKLIYPNPTAPYFDGHRVPRTTEISYWFEFGWC